MHRISTQKLVVMFVSITLLMLVYRYVGSPFMVKKSYSQSKIRLTHNARDKTPKDVFQARQEHLRNACVNQGYTPPTTLFDSNILGRSLIEIPHNILFCPIEKVGSTFWKRTISAIHSQGRFNNPYGVRLSVGTQIPHYQHFRIVSSKHLHDWFLQHAVSLIVVRDPYTKLFSGYVDKIYHPNFLFWSLTGTRINENIRNKSASSDDIICANDITFSDFIRYINFMITQNREREVNTHFTSMHSHCNPCKVKYDYISKIETFKSDAYHIIDDWNQRFNTEITFKDFERDSAKMIASIRIRVTFKAMSEISQKCSLPIEMFLQRTWEFLQISGQIPKTAKMPFPDIQPIDKVTKDSFYEAVAKVIEGVTDWDVVKKQRQEALVQAYHSVSDSDLSVLSNIVRTDCEYFDYDNRPSSLFDKNDTSNDFKYFDWL